MSSQRSKRVLILGGSGMLGHKLVQVFSGEFETYCTLRGQKDSFLPLGIVPADRVFDGVTADDFRTLERVIRLLQPDVVINAIGTIKQLPSSKNVVQTLTTNAILPNQVADLAKEVGFKFITVSTDCVFSGEKGNYSENDFTDARDVYGLSKYLGEVTGPNCLTLRTSIIGREIGTSHSLIEWFLSQDEKVKGYVNAIYSGFPTIVFAKLIKKLINEFPSLEGLYHVSSEPINKYDLLVLVKERLGLEIEIERYEDFWIDRSLDSTRFREATDFVPLPWIEMVDRMFSDPTPYDEWNKHQ